jgi:hypothetical protein
MHFNLRNRFFGGFAFWSLLAAASVFSAQAQLLWTVGLDDNGWPLTGVGGGAATIFVQENGAINPLPGNPASPAVNGQADNDYYLAGIYTNVISSVVARSEYGDYTPVGVVSANEEAAERAFAGGNLDLRYHFNLPSTLKTNDFLTITYDIFNLDQGAANPDPRFGIEVYFNGMLVQTQLVIYPAQINTDYTTPRFSLASVNAKVGPGFDNFVSLRGISYNSDGGGNWMGIDYVQLNAIVATNPPPLPLLYAVGLDDNAWPVGKGGGATTSFVQENGSINALPGSPTSTSVSRGADNDYYFAGTYSTTISSVVTNYGDYKPVGVVAVNEEAAERAFADADLDLRYHLNLPSTLKPFDLLSVTFDVFNLDDPSDVNTDPRHGVEVYFNGILVQPQILVRPVDLGTDYTTAQFRLDSVNAQVGPGFDNILSLKGVNYNADGGGNWMGIDYVQINAGASALPPDTNAPTVVSVAHYGDVGKLKVTFSEAIRATTATVTNNYQLSGGQIVTLAALQADGKSVVLTVRTPVAIGTTNSLTVTGIQDVAGNLIGTTGNQVSFTAKFQVLLVTADAGPLTFAGDQAVLQRLQARGYDVTISTGAAVANDGSAAVGKDLVIVSSSLASGDVIAATGGAKFLRSPVPVIVWESALEDDFSFQSAGGATVDAQTQINIVNPNHPLAGGFPAGPLTVTTSPQIFSTGTPVGAHVIATGVTTNSSLALLYYYDKGEKGATNFVMPARRVFFFLQDLTAASLNAAGTKLFDAAVDFAMAVQPNGSTNAPTLPMILTVGLDDNAQPVTGTGGGANAAFVQETGTINPLPGNPSNVPTVPATTSADNDYYFAGVYTTVIPSVVANYIDYTPVDVVAADEEAAERAFAGGDLDLRYHLNLPASLKTNDLLSVTFDMVSLHTPNPDPRFGVAVLFNGIMVQPEIVIRPAQLGADYTTPEFTLASVNAKAGPGFDNIVTLRGVSYNADGGGNWMGVDYVQVNAGPAPAPSTSLKFLTTTVSNGRITLNWTGTGTLQSAPTVLGPWTSVTPAPSATYSESITSAQGRFYRLRSP